MKKILPGCLALFVVAGIGLLLVIQLLPVGKDQTNPAVLNEPAWDSPQTRALAKRACFDCHSNETVWPAYSRVAPVSWLVWRDVVEGREELNFSTWGSNMRKKPGKMAEESVEHIEKGEMPPRIYLLLHPEARLSAAEKDQLAAGLQASLAH